MYVSMHMYTGYWIKDACTFIDGLLQIQMLLIVTSKLVESLYASIIEGTYSS